MKRLFTLAILPVLCLAQTVSAADTPQTGDQRRSYDFSEAGRAMPYRLYVPSTYDPKRKYPLVVVLHGGGNDENQPIDKSTLREEAEKRGLIVVSPLGYNRFSAYGTVFPLIGRKKDTVESRAAVRQASATDDPTKPLPTRSSQQGVAAKIEDSVDSINASLVVDPYSGLLGEKDVMNVIALVESEYSVDPARIYLMGNSMGGLGTQYLGAKYAEKFAALAPAGGPLAAWSYPYHRLANNKVPILYIHGDGDEVSHYSWSEALAKAAKKNRVDARALIVKGGSHGDAWIKAIPQTLDFLLRHRKRK